jgi:hypothetical protein
LPHLFGQGWLGRKASVGWDPGLLTTGAVGGPLLRQIELAVQQGMAVPARITQKDPDLAVLDLAGRAAIWPGHAGRVLPCFQKSRLVDDQHAVRVPQMLDHIAAQLIAHGLGLPQGAAQQVLKAIGRGIAGHFGQWPAVWYNATEESLPRIDADQDVETGGMPMGPIPNTKVSKYIANDKYVTVGRGKDCWYIVDNNGKTIAIRISKKSVED